MIIISIMMLLQLHSCINKGIYIGTKINKNKQKTNFKSIFQEVMVYQEVILGDILLLY